ncbi:Calcineurin-like phosphoesterase [Caminicella sporogenes DSM 14501]|uniref:Calcineurin-like phosphoesterase n=1 Tax=Caminicella sporogenes DSM 14501 TaxID=1121266 RepID=A0A1M6Q7M9_9FIRM|nr:metallophosphoesterase [Caminicella sporogenes]RKD23605.1 hypothetical protein BET04_04190 [Caminicella sporogenes]WIF93947.1 metallophosphoesterase [Caminicella sporogenes]SHK16158.1 Calcineurin-like phosphoesterase [Caminicella sporogenes DSM 14501]
MKKRFKEFFYYLFGGIYIPKELVNTREKILLHISDTPAMLYRGLDKFIRELRPNYIVHTGDIVDNIKLEIYPNKICEYRKNLKKIIDILESSRAEKIYISLGNHDNKEVVNSLIKRSIIIEKSDIINIEGIEIKVSHFPDEILKDSRKYNLFGHDLTLKTKIKDEKVYLNGISSINVLLFKSEKIFTLPYPFGTDDSRLCKGKTGF